MIEITRTLAGRLKTVFCQMITASGRGAAHEPVQLAAGSGGLHIRIATRDTAVECHVPQACRADAVSVPFSCLRDCQGTREDTVQIEATGSGEVLAAWNDRGRERMVRYGLPVERHPFAELPTCFVENPAELTGAL